MKPHFERGNLFAGEPGARVRLQREASGKRHVCEQHKDTRTEKGTRVHGSQHASLISLLRPTLAPEQGSLSDLVWARLLQSRTRVHHSIDDLGALWEEGEEGAGPPRAAHLLRFRHSHGGMIFGSA